MLSHTIITLWVGWGGGMVIARCSHLSLKCNKNIEYTAR